MRQDESVWKGGKQMRLIDADEFKKQIAGMAIVNNYPADKANKICELIDMCPTAYDVNKVKERLNELKEIYPVGNGNYEYAVRSDKAIEIVEAGGINENR